ncbi:UNVERIFIED_CONTAM: hypothetical protein Slati_3980500 [Sesamum latifolium]|uniref:Reverse transcriptase domain-containing protein n=1 Tax=Sesamum latifolium TaxID=2727402 RepID=A0AAW2TSR9_9LAMI
MNNALLQLFTSEEITLALKQMHPLKSSGPDDFLNNGSFNPLVNITHIVLIPKCLNPHEMSHFRPIILYRYITDNVLVTYELNHFLKYKNKGKKSYVFLKLDVSKAYDRVERRFLESVLIRLGFHPRFVSLIMTCVTTVSFSYLLNEAFSGMIHKVETEGHIERIAVSRIALTVPHLLFADDTLIFCQASLEALSCIRGILQSFENASGLKINTYKSAMVFSRNVEEDSRFELANILGVTVAPKHDKYIGLPTVVGRSKRELFEGIKDRIWHKLHSWLAKKLSQAGWAVLLKTVLQSIHIYAMSCFWLPDSFLSEIESTMANFFWHGGNESKIHWMAWAKLCKSKANGGFGFHRLKECNLALLAKQAWRVALCPGNILNVVIGQKYFPCATFYEARLGVSPSYT